MKPSGKSKKLALVMLTVAAAWLFEKYDVVKYLPNESGSSMQVEGSALSHAIANKQSDVQVRSSGTIVKVLTDDTKGSQHQRFLVKLEGGHTILIAHNIDLAPRVPSPQEGQTIGFYGEFEWNDKGGVVHWTHHDPRGKHASGWLKYHGKIYE